MINKKASNLMVGLFIAIITAVVLLGIAKIISDNANKSSADALCKTSLYASELTQDSTLLNCKTNVITIDQETLNKINVDKYVKLHKKLENEYYNAEDLSNNEIDTNEFKVNKIIADEMVNLWSIVAEGSIKPFNSLTKKILSPTTQIMKYCYIKSFIKFDVEKNRDGNIINNIINDGYIDYSMNEETKNKDSLVYFMYYNPVSANNDQSYYNYLKDEDSVIESYLNVVTPILEDNQIDQKKEYYIIYRKTYIYPANNVQLISGVLTFMTSGLFNNGLARKVLQLGSAIILVDNAMDKIKERLKEDGIDEIILIDTKNFKKYTQDVSKDERLCTDYIN